MHIRRMTLYVLAAVAVAVVLPREGRGAAAALDDGTRCMDLASKDYDACVQREKNFWFARLCELDYHAAVKRCKQEVAG